MSINIDALHKEELISLNHRIVERIRLLDQMHSHVAMMKFDIGEIIEFTPENSPPILAKILRYNKKTVSVITKDGHKWTVSPRFLKKSDRSKKVDPLKFLT